MTKEEAIRRLKEGEPFSEIYNKEWEEAKRMAIEALNKHKTGKWIYDGCVDRCSNCGASRDTQLWDFYCGRCGAEMEDE